MIFSFVKFRSYLYILHLFSACTSAFGISTEEFLLVEIVSDTTRSKCNSIPFNSMGFKTSKIQDTPNSIASHSWYLDPDDRTSKDNTGTIRVDENGNRYKRIITDNTIRVSWFKPQIINNQFQEHDRKAIQAAIDAAAGKTLFWDGTYRVSRLFGVSNCVIDGKGIGKLELTHDSTLLNGYQAWDSAILWDNKENITIKNLEVDGRAIRYGGRAGGIGANTFDFRHCKNILIDHVNIHHNSGGPIRYGMKTQNLRVVNSRFVSDDTAIIGLFSVDKKETSRNLVVENCYFEGGTSEGINTAHTDHVIIQCCTFKQKSDYSSGIHFWTARNILVTDNLFDGIANGGIATENWSYVTNAVLARNTFKRLRTTISGSYVNSLISYNRIDTSEQSAMVFGRGDFPCKNLTVSNNTIMHYGMNNDFSQAAIELLSGSGNVIENNTIIGDGVHLVKGINVMTGYPDKSHITKSTIVKKNTIKGIRNIDNKSCGKGIGVEVSDGTTGTQLIENTGGIRNGDKSSQIYNRVNKGSVLVYSDYTAHYSDTLITVQEDKPCKITLPPAATLNKGGRIRIIKSQGSMDPKLVEVLPAISDKIVGTSIKGVLLTENIFEADGKGVWKRVIKKSYKK